MKNITVGDLVAIRHPNNKFSSIGLVTLVNTSREVNFLQVVDYYEPFKYQPVMISVQFVVKVKINPSGGVDLDVDYES